MPSSVVVFHINQRFVASVKIFTQQNSFLRQIKRRRGIFGFDIFELGDGRNAFRKMKNSGSFGSIETNGFVFVKKAERKFIKRLSNSLPFKPLNFRALPCGSVNCKNALSISFKILSDFFLAVGGNKNSQVGRHQGTGSFFFNHLGKVFVGSSFFLLFFSYSGSSFLEEEPENIKSPIKEKTPVPVILAFFKASKVFSLFLFLRRFF